jgi:hypothetical protein
LFHREDVKGNDARWYGYTIEIKRNIAIKECTTQIQDESSSWNGSMVAERKENTYTKETFMLRG